MSKPSKNADLAASLAVNFAKAASRNTDSVRPAPPGTVPGDRLAQKAADTQTLAARMSAAMPPCLWRPIRCSKCRLNLLPCSGARAAECVQFQPWD